MARLSIVPLVLALAACSKPAAPPPAKAQAPSAPAAAAAPAPAPTAAAGVAPVTLTMAVTEKGFEPDKLSVHAGQPVRLVITRKTDKTCATAIVIEGAGVHADLPLG